MKILADDFTVLADVLKDAGHRTFGISSNTFLTRETGFAQGFHVFEQFDFTDGAGVRNAAVRRLAAIKASRSYFAWIHFVDPHEPYRPRDAEERLTAEEQVGCSQECFEKRFH